MTASSLGRRSAARVARVAWVAFACLATAHAVAAPPLAVCMAEDNPPLSSLSQGPPRGLDVRLAEAVAAEAGRELRIVPFESKRDGDSSLSQEVNALLSSGVCELASGFALIASDLGPPGRPTARVPDHPGAPRRPSRPWVALEPLAASRAYQAMAMGLVVREPAHEAMTLAEPGDARIGVVSGTLAGSAVWMYRHGRLRAQTVSIAQNQDVLVELEAGRVDAALLPLARLDAWRLKQPQTPLRRSAYVHPLRINIGFVARAAATDVLQAADRVIDRALASGELRRWAEASGATWFEPVEPRLSTQTEWMELLRD